ncbi:hypothetical protein K6U29_14010 [Vibrio parahaemolyticus]|uniref:hypothetical protein n=1 Tax=Vibrio parahaemolyticus TaxID=670 RepID=UPI001EEBB5FB|nr:hypothetical protein [Vibrio parahaemolyticus]MCG6456885.1 hypothetical protein [Vibrio parahaemolyticus]
MQLLEVSFITFFVAGALLVFWYLIVGILLIVITPQKVKHYAYTSEHYTEVELALVSGFHFGALIHGLALVAAVAFPKLAKKRKSQPEYYLHEPPQAVVHKYWSGVLDYFNLYSSHYFCIFVDYDFVLN